jgi:hypothetical protein
MLYNSSKPRGVVMRSAVDPCGPWSEAAVAFDPWRDDGYGHFLHTSSKHKGRNDTFADPGRDEEWGGEYGPYLMGRFTTGANGRWRIHYTLSTWNPYQVVVMRSDLELKPRGK